MISGEILKITLLVFASILGSFSFIEAQELSLDALAPGLNKIQIKHHGHSRRLLITAPTSFASGTRYATLLCFHGAGGKADGQSIRWGRHADSRRLLVVSCGAVQPMAKWNFKDHFHDIDHDDVGFVTDVIEALVAARVTDPHTIYATGHSSGGLFCYRLAKQTDLFAALAPMSCGMAKADHTPEEGTQPVSIFQVIGNQDKSFHGSSNPKVTMYSADERINIWRMFNQCDAQPTINQPFEKITLRTYGNAHDIEVVLCTVAGEGHHIRHDLRDKADRIALEFLMNHRRNADHKQDKYNPNE
jgi:polyhydroxybutyrate depolymerase